MSTTCNFNQVLEIIETLSDEKQEELVDVVHKQLIERRREEIADNIATVHQEYKEGKVLRRNIDE